MLKIIKVTGTSLSPFFLPGDYVVVAKMFWHRKGPQVGDIVVFNHDRYGLLIKRIQSRSADGADFVVGGNQPDSLDSTRLGLISQDDMLGSVIWHIKRPSQKAARKARQQKS